ncbi:MAG: hypothetical protein M3024_01475, partial [Candidatus Dormibacteraeota bacterium]|nr:hypothetical protein [Candidatus Dormibacteraeota bacterium]
MDTAGPAKAEVCVKDPGLDEDMVVTTDSVTLTDLSQPLRLRRAGSVDSPVRLERDVAVLARGPLGLLAEAELEPPDQ